ncbi:ABC transporter ATP-binding protein [Rhodopseudomonas boonkerdii]|uniref:ABC transporter ATP-binding protein n=1 Tax=Rhodopseudomonas boonkerdii TaxID=475937 RepID=UPI001E62D331|nr:ABC transporter ATP-binding protein [Rhodopseudomonas boonkerdii]UGV27771.1 ABC transporter ATP-binding protein [Rhodopseudomonas boonkerdii]
MPLLEVKNLTVSYGKALAIESVSITVEKGELIGVLGPNGAGKTTLLKAISRSIAAQGTLNFKDASLHPVEPYNVVAKGICHCPEGRKLFSELSVLKNLQLGAYLRKNKSEIDSDLERVFTLFPVLRERQWQQSSTLSGGEQQMVAIGRALMGRPELLLLDEPSVGIAPRLKGLIFDSITQIRRDGTAILIVEQDATSTLRIADRIYVLEHGRTVREGTAQNIAGDKYIQQIYLGV